MINVLVTGIKGNLSKAVADWLRSKDDFTINQVSLRGEWENQSFLETDCIVHVVGVTPQNVKTEDDYFTINKELTQKLAEKAKKEGVKQFVYISSMAVYGIEQQMTIMDGMVSAETPCNPNTLYGKSKFAAEKVISRLHDDSFIVSIIRVPSIYAQGKTEYTDQYKYLADKLPIIPIAYPQLYKSMIYIDNLCEVIYLAIKMQYSGIICPDDGKISAVDVCKAIDQHKKCSLLAGKIIEFFLHKNDRIRDYYGAVYYSESLTDIFEGKYRIVPYTEALKKIYG